MINITLTEKYTDAYDNAMRTTLEVIKGAYADYQVNQSKPYSVSIPNDATGQDTVAFYDGDQPVYNGAKRFEELAANLGLEFGTIADYPRYNDTLRFKFKTEADAELFVRHARIMCGLEKAMKADDKITVSDWRGKEERLNLDEYQQKWATGSLDEVRRLAMWQGEADDVVILERLQRELEEVRRRVVEREFYKQLSKEG